MPVTKNMYQDLKALILTGDDPQKVAVLYQNIIENFGSLVRPSSGKPFPSDSSICLRFNHTVKNPAIRFSIALAIKDWFSDERKMEVFIDNSHKRRNGRSQNRRSLVLRIN